MAGASIQVTLEGVEEAQRLLLQGLDSDLLMDVMRPVAELVVGQTKGRIQSEKESPDGTKWPAWSDRYRRSPLRGPDLLRQTGRLQESVVGQADEGTAEVGTNLVYAATHQFGRGGIPARPFLGLSGDNLREVEDLLGVVVSDLLQ